MSDLKVKHWRGILKTKFDSLSQGLLSLAALTDLAEKAEKKGNTFLIIEVPEKTYNHDVRYIEEYLQKKYKD